MKSIFGKRFSFEGKDFFLNFTPSKKEVNAETVKVYGEFVLQKWGRESHSGYLWYDTTNRTAALVQEHPLSIFQEDGLCTFVEIILDEQERFESIKDYVPPKQYTYRALPFSPHKATRIRRFNSAKDYTAWWIEVPSGEVIVEAALVGTSTLVFKSLLQFMTMTGRGRLIGPRISKSPEIKRYKHNRETQRVNVEVKRLLGELYIE